MNNTEQFDEWIREEMDNLDSPPENFLQANIWQKLQTELHPVSEKKSFFIKRVFATPEASKFRIAAALALLLMAGGIWWRVQPTPTQMVVNRSVDKPKSSPVLLEKQPLPAKESDLQKEGAVIQKQKLSEKKLPEINLIQVPALALTESENNVGKDWPAPADRSVVPNLADVPLANIVEAPQNTVTISDEQLPEKTLSESANPTNRSAAKAPLKPKFKIVHANELADYQKAELAEVREKEAKAKGFVVINWNANSTNQPSNSLLTYFKRKSSKAD